MAMENDSEEFTPIIAAGVEYSGVSNYRPPSQRAPVPRIPHNAPHVPAAVSQKKGPVVTPTRSDSVLKKTASANGRIMSSPRTLVSQSKSLPFNYGVPEVSTLRTSSSGGTPVAVAKTRNAGASEVSTSDASTPSPYRTASSGGIPVAPAKNRHAESSTPRLRRSMSSAGVGDSTGAAMKHQQSQAMSAEYRLSNGHGRGEDSAVKAAPIRHLSFSRGSFKQVSVDIRRLRQLARQGSWKLLIERVKDAQRRGLLASPDQEIAYGTYHLLALIKLQDYRAAAQEIAAFGDLDASQYRFENHPKLYPEQSGSMVPFALRCMHAELPHRIGNTAETLHRLYNLLAHCDSQIDALQAERSRDETESTTSVGSDSDTAILEGFLATWQKRLETVRFSIVGYHLHQQQFMVALQWLNKLMASSPSDPLVKTKVALVQVQLGDVVGAQRTFSDVEALLSSSSDPDMKNLLARNRGILFVALGEFAKAIAEFDAVLAADPTDIVSANNKALCLLYNQRLVDATDVLEDAIFRGPKLMINEAVVVNICSMYELVSFSGAATKRSLRTWMKDHGPDDFDAAMFRL